MAKTQIGAIIGVEGAAEYKRQINECVVATRNLASVTKLVEQSFQGQTKTIADLAKQKLALKGQIAGVQEKLALQRAELSKVVEAYQRGDENALKYKDAMIRLATETNKTETELYKLEQQLNDLPADNFIGKLDLIKQNLQNNQSELKKWGDLLTDVGKALTIGVTVPIVGAATASVKAATDWESAVNGVVKTTGLAGTELEMFKEDMQDMALTTTYSAEELMNMAQIAGQLGVHGSEDLLHFVEVVSDLGIATDLTGEEAATALARIFNITENGKFDNLEKIGSVIVHLGNNMATTEPEIVAMANRMASAGKTAGLTTQDIFALSAALSSVGITAEAGGSTIGQVLTKTQLQFDKWTAGTENDLEKIAEVSGMSAEQFAQTWKDEPIKAFEAFVTGLGNLGEDSESVSMILDELGMAGIRESNMLKALANAQEEGVDTTQLFTKALELTEEAYNGVNAEGEKFNALTQEADVRKGESATSFANLKEAISQLAIAFGEELLPLLIPFIEDLTAMIKTFSDMDDGTKKLILSIAGILAAIGPVVTVIGTVLGLMSSVAVIATTLGVTIGALVTPVAAVVAAVVAFIAALVAIVTNWDAIVEDLKARFEIFKIIVKYLGEEIWGFLTDLFSQIGSGLASFLDMIGSGILSFVERVISNIILGGINIVNKVKETWNNIKSGWRSLVSEASMWGSDLIQNIISGITSKISSLVSAVSNVASRVRSYLHFSEPDVGPLSDFHTWMPDMMKGLAKGIEDNLYLVDNAIGDVASTLSGGTNVNYGGVVINLNVPQGANGQQILNEIETELANRTLRRRAVFG